MRAMRQSISSHHVLESGSASTATKIACGSDPNTAPNIERAWPDVVSLIHRIAPLAASYDASSHRLIREKPTSPPRVAPSCCEATMLFPSDDQQGEVTARCPCPERC